MKKYYLIFLSLLFIFPISVFAEEEKFNELISNAVSGLLMEQSTGEILFEKDKDKQVPVASMTKMVAQTIILERIESGKIKWDDIVEVSKNAADMGGSQIYLTAGEKMSVRDLFKGISMASGNDATVAMAEYIAGDEASFVKLMNKKVKKLGLKNTQFKNCTGLDEVTDICKKINYCNKSYYKRYKAYYKKNKDLSKEDVITRVNMGIDNSLYTHTKEKR